MGMLDYRRPNAKRLLLAGAEPRWIANSKRKNYIRQVVLSIPFWVKPDELKLVKLRCQQTTALSGEEHHVCHIIPLNHPRVCGLTVPWNLEIKTAKINLAESNHIQLDDQLELF